jgi:predicted phage tail protein
MTKTAATKFQVRWRKSDEPDTLWSSPVDVGKDGNIDVPGLERVTDYVFQARAGSACGAWSDWVVQTFNMPEAAAPEAVSSLTAQSVADGVHLSWASIIADGGTKFAIERSTSSDSGFAERARTTATAYTDPETSGTVFYYRVRAVNYRGSFGPYSNVVSSQGVAVDALGDDVAAA